MCASIHNFSATPQDVLFLKNFFRMKFFKNSKDKAKIQEILDLPDQAFIKSLFQLQKMVTHQRSNNASRSIFVRLLKLVQASHPHVDIPNQKLFSKSFYKKYLIENKVKDTFVELLNSKETKRQIAEESKKQFMKNFDIFTLMAANNRCDARVRMGLVPAEIEIGFQQFNKLLR